VTEAERTIDRLPVDLEQYLDAHAAYAETGREDLEAQVEALPRPRIDRPRALALMRRLQRMDRAAAEEDAAYAAEIERLEQARRLAQERHARRREGLTALLESYLRDLMATDPRVKSVDLAPYGRVQSRRVPAQPKVADEALLLRWAEGAGFVEMRPHLRWAELKKALAVADDGRVLLDGEPVPGVESVPERLDVAVKTSEEAI
jgi:hypothetical protein